jgi:hypothetical protein
LADVTGDAQHPRDAVQPGSDCARILHRSWFTSDDAYAKYREGFRAVILATSMMGWATRQ